MIHELIKIPLVLFSVSLFNKEMQRKFKIHSLLLCSQYLLYWVYLLQAVQVQDGISILNEILNFGIFLIIILCIQTNSHVFIIWFLWNLSIVRNFDAVKDLYFLSCLIIGTLGCLSLRRKCGKVGGKSPEETANYEQLITFSWFNDLLDYGTQNVLNMENIYNLMEKDTSKKNYERFKEIR